MMGFENLQHLAHKGEDMFFVIREKPEIAKNAHFVYELIFEVSDLYKAEIEYIQNSGDDDYTPTDFSETFKKLEDATEKLKAMENGTVPATETAASFSLVSGSIIFRKVKNRKKPTNRTRNKVNPPA